MGKISQVYFEQLDPNVCSAMKASEYHFYANTIGLHPKIDEAYEKYETEQMRIRNKVIGSAVRDGIIPRLKMDTTIYGVSSLRDRAIVITEI